ncbi:potassium-transporting ATPase [Cutibacterium acnes JCM 18920]|nr:potassium-transporting ATPase [Cutibacterium acnes JCM 18920]
MSVTVLVALLVCLVPTTIGALLSAIGIAGMDRLVQHNVLAMSGRAVEAAGDVTTLLLDKTGTITYGNRRASEFIPMSDVSDEEIRDAAARSSLADPTPEAPPSSTWPASRASSPMPAANRGRSSPLPRRPECRASTFPMAPKSVRVPDLLCAPG